MNWTLSDSQFSGSGVAKLIPPMVNWVISLQLVQACLEKHVPSVQSTEFLTYNGVSYEMRQQLKKPKTSHARLLRQSKAYFGQNMEQLKWVGEGQKLRLTTNPKIQQHGIVSCI